MQNTDHLEYCFLCEEEKQHNLTVVVCKTVERSLLFMHQWRCELFPTELVAWGMENISILWECAETLTFNWGRCTISAILRKCTHRWVKHDIFGFVLWWCEETTTANTIHHLMQENPTNPIEDVSYICFWNRTCSSFGLCMDLPLRTEFQPLRLHLG